jgi:hypothetical protein
MAQGTVGDVLGSRGEVKGFERNPAGVAAPPEHFEHGFEIVVAGAAMTAVEFVDVNVADQIEIAVHQFGVGHCLEHGIVDVEHGAHRGTIDLLDDADGFFERLNDVALIDGERLDEDGDTAGGGMRGDGGEAIDEVAGGLFACDAASGAALLGRAENQDAIGAEIGAEVDQVADVVPSTRANIGVGGSDVEILGSDHEPVESDEGKAGVGDRAAAVAALVGGDSARVFAEREGGDFDSRVPCFAESVAGVCERVLFESFVAHGVAERHEILVYLYGGWGLAAARFAYGGGGADDNRTDE